MVTPMTPTEGGGEPENRRDKKSSRNDGGGDDPLWGYYTFIARHGRAPGELFPGLSREPPSEPLTPENK